MRDAEFDLSVEGLRRAIDLMAGALQFRKPALPSDMPATGLGAGAALEVLAPYILGGATPLGAELSLAHMDPPTPWIAWAATLWNASLNQNLLHPATSPVAREAEEQVIRWLAPFFGMQGGHT